MTILHRLNVTASVAAYLLGIATVLFVAGVLIGKIYIQDIEYEGRLSNDINRLQHSAGGAPSRSGYRKNL